jgi:hypothetical protein
MVMKFKFLLFVMIIVACSSNNNNDDLPEPNQFNGEDLFSQSSDTEKILMGKWYYGYGYNEMQDGSVEISYETGLHWPTGDRTDTIQFYSNKLVGYSWDCPYENPSKPLVKLAVSEAAYFHWCFPSGVNGWIIKNDTLHYYRGFDTNDFISYPIVEINSDSIFFLSRDWPINSPTGVDKEYAVFFKKQE